MREFATVLPKEERTPGPGACLRETLVFRVHDREHGPWSTIEMAFDRLIFACGRAATRALMLPAAGYDSEPETAGMQVEERRFRNRVRLAHILSIAKKPLAEGAGA
ncbi:MAG: hypothetical protein WCA20_17890 [Candidatus Sulfotelmatobacter sp.]